MASFLHMTGPRSPTTSSVPDRRSCCTTGSRPTLARTGCNRASSMRSARRAVRVITLDARGHGRSGKPHDPSAYDGLAMVHDVQRLLDHLSLDSIDMIGYSMGSLVTASLLVNEPRVRSGVLGGVGARLLLLFGQRQGADAVRGDRRGARG